VAGRIVALVGIAQRLGGVLRLVPRGIAVGRRLLVVACSGAGIARILADVAGILGRVAANLGDRSAAAGGIFGRRRTGAPVGRVQVGEVAVVLAGGVLRFRDAAGVSARAAAPGGRLVGVRVELALGLVAGAGLRRVAAKAIAGGTLADRGDVVSFVGDTSRRREEVAGALVRRARAVRRGLEA